MSQSSDLLQRCRAIEADSREINRRLNDYDNTPSFIERESLKARLSENPKMLAKAYAAYRRQVVVENRELLHVAESELETIKPSMEKAYRIVQNAAIFADANKAAANPHFAKAQSEVAEARQVLYQRDDIISRMARARALIIENEIEATAS